MIGEMLKEWRETSRYKQDEVAEMLGITIGYVGKIERGVKIPSPAIEKQILQLLGSDKKEEPIKESIEPLFLRNNLPMFGAFLLELQRWLNVLMVENTATLIRVIELTNQKLEGALSGAEEKELQELNVLAKSKGITIKMWQELFDVMQQTFHHDLDRIEAHLKDTPYAPYSPDQSYSTSHH